MKKINVKKVLLVFLTLLISCCQISIATDNKEVTKDGSYLINYTEDIYDLKDGLKSGEINVLKSVKYNKDLSFDVSLKAQGLGFSKEKISKNNYNIVFAIDNSGSMYGDSGRIQACVSAINSVIKDLSSSPNIQIAVVAYSSGAHLDYSSDGSQEQYISSNNSSSGVLLALDHYDSNAYIGYTDNYGTDTTKDYNSRNTLRWMYSSTGKKFYAGRTNTQAGIIKSYEVLQNASNKNNATPVIVLMSDGEATNYAYSGNDLTGYKYEIDTISALDKYKSAFSNVYSQNQLPAYNAILSANYVKNKLEKSYNKKCKFYTLGYSLEQNYEYSLATLNPTNSNLKKSQNCMENSYKNYGLYSLINSTESTNFKNKYGLSSLKYNDKYYEGSVQNIKSVYSQIVNDSITEYEDFGPVKEGTNLTIEDAIDKGFKINIDTDNIEMTLSKSVIGSDKKEQIKINLTKKSENKYEYTDEGISVIYNVINNKVTFKISAKNINGNIYDLTYKLSLLEEATGTEEGKTYYTNDKQNTYYEFEPENENPYYDLNNINQRIETTGSITLKKDKEPEKENVVEKNTVIENTTINNTTENNKNVTNENIINKNTINENVTNKNITNEDIVNKNITNETINNKVVNNETENNNKTNNKIVTNNEIKLPKTGY